MANTTSLQDWFNREVGNVAEEIVGGGARLKVIILLACVLALDSADKATIGAVAMQLKNSMHIGNVQIGLLVTASTGIGALATLPVGILTDRIHRAHLLAGSILLWSVAMVISGFSSSYTMLFITRLALGAVIATAYPAITSLTGDYFRPGVRGRIWGYILSGELFGAGFGILISGEVAALLSWRSSFWVLAAISLIMAVAVWFWLPEPKRGVQTHLRKGKEEIPSTEEMKSKDGNPPQEDEAGKNEKVEKKIKKQEVQPHEEQVLDGNPADMSFWSAVRYILSIRTNVLLIIASACGYFFFTGLRTFAVIYLRGRFDLGQGTGRLALVGLGFGAIAGVFITGRLADKLIERGHLQARVTVGAVAFLVTAVLFLSGLFMNSLYLAAPLFFLAATGLGGTNAPLDAARLDIMHSRLWGRAESVRTTLRYLLEALAPVVFGWISTLFGGSTGLFAEGSQSVGSGSMMPLTYTFQLMLIPVLLAGIILYFARSSYPRDVATVLASENAKDFSS